MQSKMQSKMQSNIQSNIPSSTISILQSNTKSILQSKMQSNIQSNIPSSTISILQSNTKSILQSNTKSILQSNTKSILQSNTKSIMQLLDTKKSMIEKRHMAKLITNFWLVRQINKITNLANKSKISNIRKFSRWTLIKKRSSTKKVVSSMTPRNYEIASMTPRNYEIALTTPRNYQIAPRSHETIGKASKISWQISMNSNSPKIITQSNNLASKNSLGVKSEIKNSLGVKSEIKERTFAYTLPTFKLPTQNFVSSVRSLYKGWPYTPSRIAWRSDTPSRIAWRSEGEKEESSKRKTSSRFSSKRKTSFSPRNSKSLKPEILRISGFFGYIGILRPSQSDLKTSLIKDKKVQNLENKIPMAFDSFLLKPSRFSLEGVSRKGVNSWFKVRRHIKRVWPLNCFTGRKISINLDKSKEKIGQRLIDLRFINKKNVEFFLNKALQNLSLPKRTMIIKPVKFKPVKLRYLAPLNSLLKFKLLKFQNFRKVKNNKVLSQSRIFSLKLKNLMGFKPPFRFMNKSFLKKTVSPNFQETLNKTENAYSFSNKSDLYKSKEELVPWFDNLAVTNQLTIRPSKKSQNILRFQNPENFKKLPLSWNNSNILVNKDYQDNEIILNNQFDQMDPNFYLDTPTSIIKGVQKRVFEGISHFKTSKLLNSTSEKILDSQSVINTLILKSSQKRVNNKNKWIKLSKINKSIPRKQFLGKKIDTETIWNVNIIQNQLLINILPEKISQFPRIKHINLQKTLTSSIW